MGRAVIKAVAEQIQAKNQIGKATMEITDFGTIANIIDNATVTISTRDFEVVGTITIEDGVLTWGEIDKIKPGIKIIDVPAALEKNAKTTLNIKRKEISNTVSVTWESLNPDFATVNESTGEVTGVEIGTAKIKATATDNGTTYTAECTIKVEMSKEDKINSKIGTEILYPKAQAGTATTDAVAGYTADYNGTWKIFYANSEEMFIIPSTIVPAYTVGFDTSGIPITNEAEANGSKSVATSKPAGSSENTRGYGYKYNNSWLQKCGQITSTGTVDSEVKLNENRHKATAYLCNPDNWESFVAKTTGTNPTNLISGSYAVGGPTYELFIDAWNKVKNDNIKPRVYDLGYGHVLGNSRSISTSDGNGLFIPSASGSYWLASPYEMSDLDKVLFISCIGGYMLNDEPGSSRNGIRPLVSIPLSNVKVDSTTGDVNILTDAQLQQ